MWTLRWLVHRSLAFSLSTWCFLVPVLTTSKKVAVIHVGPRKTGTTSIQKSIDIYKEAFRKDSYLVVDYDSLAGLRDFNKTKPSRMIARCCKISGSFREERSCDEGYFEKIRNVLHDDKDTILRSSNLIFSSEYLDGPLVDGMKVRELLEGGWDVRIVVAYRRYFEWVSSLYSELHRVDKTRGSHGRVQTWPNWKSSSAKISNVKSWWEKKYTRQFHEGIHTPAVFERYRQVFDDVSVLNMHDGSQEVVDNFFCEQVPNATFACQALRDLTENQRQPNWNAGASTAYDELAVAAYLSGFVNGGNISRQEMRDRIQERQEGKLNLTANDFPKDCLSEDMLDQLLKQSLLAEQMVLPSFYASPLGEEDLRRQFQVAATSTLCAVDVKKVLADSDWIAFFKSVGGNNLSHDESHASSKVGWKAGVHPSRHPPVPPSTAPISELDDVWHLPQTVGRMIFLISLVLLFFLYSLRFSATASSVCAGRQYSDEMTTGPTVSGASCKTFKEEEAESLLVGKNNSVAGRK
eukprot:CAMPEP_0195509500 /NCGR_PEP_ID=MMETSP0794_2-20130614/2417_1 /TAXON_ID=515487 /ORGANISM="Stephanopyxis turris, Strain CCMP 815" /LENGTH=520 /DNA_ID=CAMNT_0040636733 /DNA_START=176 /DNA_END=1738 /DNA_ORIENTATION=-